MYNSTKCPCLKENLNLCKISRNKCDFSNIFSCFCLPGLPLDLHTTPERPTSLPNMCGTSHEWSTVNPSAHTFAPGEVGQHQSGGIWVE